MHLLVVRYLVNKQNTFIIGLSRTYEACGHDVHIKEIIVDKTLVLITEYVQYTFITTAECWEKNEEDLHSVVLDINQKKFERLNERNGRE